MNRRWARPRALTLLFLLAAGLTVGGLHALEISRQQRALSRVLRAHEARRNVPAKGTVVTRTHSANGPATSRAEVHCGGGHSAIKYLDGPARGMMVCRHGRSVWRTGGGGRDGLALEASAEASAPDEKLLRANYLVRPVHRETVAGRPATHILVRQKHGAFGMDLWLDDDTDFPLRTVMLTPEGRVASDTGYEKIEFGVPAPDSLEPPEAPDGPGPGVLDASAQDAAKIAREAGFEFRRPTQVPTAFVERQWFVHRFRGRRQPGIELRYTDGLATFSVIEMAPHRGGGGPGRSGPGMQGGRGRGGGRGVPQRFSSGEGGSVVRRLDDLTVVVLGQLPRAELERVADSIR